jgi:hypothetical protein
VLCQIGGVSWVSRGASCCGAAAGVDVEAVTEAARLRRRRCAISDEEDHRPKWTLAVEMLDALAAQGFRPPLRIEHDYRELNTGLGLDHFEGRSSRPRPGPAPAPPATKP